MINLAEVKVNLGILDCESDSQLQSILSGCESIIKEYLGDISFGTKTELIPKSRICGDVLPFIIPNVSKILSIDGVDFSTKVNGSDYLILPNGTAEVPDLIAGITSSFTSFKVEYTAGWRVTPPSIISAVSSYVARKFAQQNGMDVTREQLGPRSVEFASPSGSQGSMTPMDVLIEELHAFYPLHLKVW